MLEITQICLGFAAGVALVMFTNLQEAAPFAGMLGAAILVLAIDWSRQARAAKGGKVDHSAAKAFADFGWLIALMIAVEQILSFADRFLIAGFLGPAKAGIFAAAFGLAPRILDIVFIAIARGAATLNSETHKTSGVDAAQMIAERYFANLVALTLPVAALLILTARPLANVMVAPQMAVETANLIPWLTISGLIAGFVTYYFGESYRLGRKMTLCSMLLAISGLINIGLNIFLLPRLGLLGSAIASVSGFAVAALLLVGFSKRAFHLPIPPIDLIKALVATGLMSAAIYLLPAEGGISELALKASVGGIIYALAAVIVNVAGVRALAARLSPGPFRPPLQNVAPSVATQNDGSSSDGPA